MSERENLPIPEFPKFSIEIGGIRPDDPVHYQQINDIFTQLLSNDSYLKKFINSDKEITLPFSQWSETAPYSQNISLEGITTLDSPIPYFIDNGETEMDSKAKKKAYGYITFFESAENTITVVCKYNKPTVDFKIGLKGVL